jgi:hypothetical protein
MYNLNGEDEKSEQHVFLPFHPWSLLPVAKASVNSGQVKPVVINEEMLTQMGDDAVKLPTALAYMESCHPGSVALLVRLELPTDQCDQWQKDLRKAGGNYHDQVVEELGEWLNIQQSQTQRQ